MSSKISLWYTYLKAMAFAFTEAIKHHITFLEKDKVKSKTDSEAVLDDVNMDDTKSTCRLEFSESVHAQAHLGSKSHSDNGTASYSGDKIITHCPYCDECLPSSPIQQLVNKCTALELKSTLDPLPGNPDHCKMATFCVYQDFCTRHCLEIEDLPLACLEQWPEDPDMAELQNQVDKLCPQLQPLFNINVLDKNKFFKKQRQHFLILGVHMADGIDVQYGKYSGHDAG